jgi:hypothetical protein
VRLVEPWRLSSARWSTADTGCSARRRGREWLVDVSTAVSIHPEGTGTDLR